MLCEKCGKNNATTHIRTVVNGVVTEHNLCGYCAAAEGYTTSSQTSLAGMLASMFGEVLDAKPANYKQCPICGATFSGIAQSGKVGCAECYTVFSAELLPYLKRVHGSTQHIGKIPNSAPLMVMPKEENVESLRMELNRLVAAEKYEEAAVLRDKIKELEAGENE